MNAKEVTIQKILEITVDMLGVDQNKINFTTSFSDDLGIDSLDVYELIHSIEKEFNLTISDEELEKITTFGKLADSVNSKLNLTNDYPKMSNKKPVSTPAPNETIFSNNLLSSSKYN